MSETPDFDQIARGIAEQLRLIWNARGAADVADATVALHPDVRAAIRSLDR